MYEITKMAGKYTQESYATVVCAIQSERIFSKCDKNMGYVFSGVEKLLPETFFPRIFIGISKSLPPIVGTLGTIRVKKFGLGLHDPVTSANKKYLSLIRVSSKLIGAVIGWI